MTKSKTITAFKAFNSDWKCRGFQYKVGKTYTHEGDVKVCKSGFHACIHPLDVLNYYPAAGAKFAKVELQVAVEENDGDTKVAGSAITITAELRLSEMVEAAVKHVFDAAKWLKTKSATGYSGAASATGYQGKVMGTDGNALFACERKRWGGQIVSVAAGIVGQDELKPNTWYFAQGGKLVEVGT